MLYYTFQLHSKCTFFLSLCFVLHVSVSRLTFSVTHPHMPSNAAVSHPSQFQNGKTLSFMTVGNENISSSSKLNERKRCYSPQAYVDELCSSASTLAALSSRLEAHTSWRAGSIAVYAFFFLSDLKLFSVNDMLRLKPAGNYGCLHRGKETVK